MIATTSTSYALMEFSASQSRYTTTQMMSALSDIPQMLLTVIDGELCLVKNETPPDAHLPDGQIHLFRCADTPIVVEASA